MCHTFRLGQGNPLYYTVYFIYIEHSMQSKSITFLYLPHNNNVLLVKNALHWRRCIFTACTELKEQRGMNNMYKITCSVTAALLPFMSFPCAVGMNREWVNFPLGLTAR